MGFEGFITKVKLGETPFYSRLNRMARKLMRWEAPYIPGLHDLLYRERQFRYSSWRNFWRAVYYQPLFRSRCISCGKELTIIHSGQGLPFISGDVDITIGENVTLYDRITIVALTSDKRKTFKIGDNTIISQRTNFMVGNEITIGSNCLIGFTLMQDNIGHRIGYKERMEERLEEERIGKIIVGDYVWAGGQSMVIGNVTIGTGAILAARTMITRDVPPFCVVAGNPARIVKKLDFPQEMIDTIGTEQYNKYLEAQVNK